MLGGESPTPAGDFGETRNGKLRVRAELQRIAEIVVEPPQDDIDRAWRAGRLEPDPPVTDDEVFAGDRARWI